MTGSKSRRTARLALALLVTALCCGTALAQGAHHPFAVGANEGAVGNVGGIGGWLIAQESWFYRLMTQALHAIKENGAAGWTLAAVSFAYGVIHAAGPGHGKAVVTSYMVSNERALRRGLVISLLAALLQGIVAVALVSIAALVFHATAPRMTAAAQMLETASYFGIAILGAILLWRKGRALISAFALLRPAPVEQLFAAGGASFAVGGRSTSAFLADAGDAHLHGPDCGHLLAMDPSKLDESFEWKGAALTILTAGARPCSGAILVLIFALAQGMYLFGIASTFAMSLGTAITTGALAALAVFAKRVAVRYAGLGSPRALILARLLEAAAALCVLLFGLALLAAQWIGLNLTAL